MGKVTIIRNGKIVELDEAAPVPRPSETAARESREDQRVRHRKDLLQKNEEAYYHAYPEAAKELPDDLRRLLS